MKNNAKLLNGVLIIGLCGGGSWAQGQIDDDDDWFGQDPQETFNAINEGELSFLEKPPQNPVHHHHNTLIVLPESIETGWVNLVQCHENLDRFPSAQIVYNKDKVRNIILTSQKNIGHAWVEGPSVQLTNVKKDARLCIKAETRALIAQSDGSFIMKNGPFMRKFLDGYFPMRVSMNIKLPKGMSFVSIEPKEQKGFTVVKGKQGIHFDAWFEGRLTTRIHLKLDAQTRIQ